MMLMQQLWPVTAHILRSCETNVHSYERREQFARQKKSVIRTHQRDACELQGRKISCATKAQRQPAIFIYRARNDADEQGCLFERACLSGGVSKQQGWNPASAISCRAKNAVEFHRVAINSLFFFFTCKTNHSCCFPLGSEAFLSLEDSVLGNTATFRINSLRVLLRDEC